MVVQKTTFAASYPASSWPPGQDGVFRVVAWERRSCRRDAPLCAMETPGSGRIWMTMTTVTEQDRRGLTDPWAGGGHVYYVLGRSGDPRAGHQLCTGLGLSGRRRSILVRQNKVFRLAAYAHVCGITLYTMCNGVHFGTTGAHCWQPNLPVRRDPSAEPNATMPVGPLSTRWMATKAQKMLPRSPVLARPIVLPPPTCRPRGGRAPTRPSINSTSDGERGENKVVILCGLMSVLWILSASIREAHPCTTMYGGGVLRHPPDGTTVVHHG